MGWLLDLVAILFAAVFINCGSLRCHSAVHCLWFTIRERREVHLKKYSVTSLRWLIQKHYCNCVGERTESASYFLSTEELASSIISRTANDYSYHVEVAGCSIHMHVQTYFWLSEHEIAHTHQTRRLWCVCAKISCSVRRVHPLASHSAVFHVRQVFQVRGLEKMTEIDFVASHFAMWIGNTRNRAVFRQWLRSLHQNRSVAFMVTVRYDGRFFRHRV